VNDPLEGGIGCTSPTLRHQGEIGEGGMGSSTGRRRKLHRDVALKVLSGRTTIPGTFIREQEITACLDHPNFDPRPGHRLLDDEGPQLPFLRDAADRGRTLERAHPAAGSSGFGGAPLRREFTQATLLRMLGQLCLTLQSAHDKRIIHRDLSLQHPDRP